MILKTFKYLELQIFIASIQFDSMSDCTICFKPTNLEVQLNCKHTACYLCVKQQINNGMDRCLLCNKKFKKNILEQQIDPENDIKNIAWYYSSVNSGKWWLFDPVSSDKLESLYDQFSNDPDYDMNINPVEISGTNYFYDFETMIQKSDHGKTRKVKREVNSKTDTAIGVAGAKYTPTVNID